MTSVKDRRAAPAKRPKKPEPERRFKWFPAPREPAPAETVEYYGHLSRKLAVANRDLAVTKAEFVVSHMKMFAQLQDAWNVIDEQAERIVELQREVERSAQIMRPFQAEVVGLPMAEFVAA